MNHESFSGPLHYSSSMLFVDFDYDKDIMILT